MTVQVYVYQVTPNQSSTLTFGISTPKKVTRATRKVGKHTANV